MALGHLDKTPAVNVLDSGVVGIVRLVWTLGFVVKDLGYLLLGEFRVRVLVVEVLCSYSGLGWVGLFVEHFLPVNSFEEGVGHDFKGAFWTSSETSGWISVQKTDHKVFSLLRNASRKLQWTVDDIVKELFFVS